MKPFYRYSLFVLSLMGFMGSIQAGPTAYEQTKNNNHIIDFQSGEAGDPSATGDVKIQFYGHAAFKLVSPSGFTMLFDPWRNDPTGYWGIWYPEEFPQIEVDAILSTHAHFDHDATERPNGQMILDRMTGNYGFSDVSIEGLADKHQCEAPGHYKWTNVLAEFGQECAPNNFHHLDNNIYIVTTGGMRIAIWGDNREDPAEHVWGQLTDIDVLVLPVDQSEHILSYEQANNVVERIKPNVIIPEHYLTKGASITLTTLGSAEEWTKSQDSFEILESPEIVLNPETVNKHDRHVMYFGDNHLKE